VRVAVVGRIFSDSFARCIVESLKDLGHDACSVDPEPMLQMVGFRYRRFVNIAARVPAMESWQDRLVVRRLVAQRPDFVIVTGRGLQPWATRRLKRMLPGPLVFWFSDPLANMGRQYPLASAYDALFYKDPYIVDCVRKKLRLQAFYLPEACHPKWHRRVSLTQADVETFACDITIASGMYYYRAKLLEPLQNYDMKIWGNYFPEWIETPLRTHDTGRWVGEIEKAKAFTAAKIVLNTFNPAEIWGVNARTFEAAGCGAFQIADSRPGLPELFEPGREIETFDTADELKDKIDYYLVHPHQRQTIADAGYARAHRDHTFHRRLLTMFGVVDSLQGGRQVESSYLPAGADS
jgi:spore maturation protein CgeB